MQHTILKAVRTLDEFDVHLFCDFGLGVELQDFTEPALSPLECYDILRRYEKKFEDFHGVKAMHGSFLDVDIASFNMDFARYSKNLYARDLFFAQVLQLDYIVFHGNIKSRIVNPAAWKLFIKLQKEFFIEALAATGYQGTVVLENILEDSPEPLFALVSGIDSPQVKVNFDFGHAKLSKLRIEMWIEKLAPQLSYVHAHSNDGVHDLHHAISFDDAQCLVKALRENNVSVPICLEYWDCDIQSEMLRLKDIL